MFVTPDDLGQVIYSYQIEQITEGDENIVLQAIAAGVEETRSYLESNVNLKENYDGRLLYDVDAIFEASGDDRNALVLQQAVTISKWHLVQLCNADIIYEQAKERYDRATAWLTKLSKGTITLGTLPTISLEADETIQPFSGGSRPKFNHE